MPTWGLEYMLLFGPQENKLEQAPAPKEVEPGIEAADIGRFRFLRHGHVVRLNVEVSGLLYRALLEVTADRNAWAWGEPHASVD